MSYNIEDLIERYEERRKFIIKILDIIALIGMVIAFFGLFLFGMGVIIT